jgi:type I restriction enzyme S subunit
MGPSSTTRERVRLGDLLKVTHGWPFKSEFFTEERKGRPIIVSIGNFQYTGGFRFESTTIKEYTNDYPKEYELSPRDILLVMTCQTAGGEILGIPARIPDDGKTYLHNQRMGKVVIKEPRRLDADFVYYLALSPDFNRELCVSASGTKILHTAPVRIEAFEFDLPPLAEQEAIAAVLGALDDKIELNRRMNATLEAMARALFQSWFVDFDPVRAKLDGHAPTGFDEATTALFPKGFYETKLRRLPLGWKEGCLGDLCTLKRGHDLPTTLRTAGDVPVISSSGTSGTHDEAKVSGPGVVTGRYGTIGKVFFVESDYWPLNTTLYVEDFKENPPRFIFHVLEDVDYSIYSDKAAVPGVNRNHLHEEPTVIPPLEVREAFANIVAPLWSQHAANERESRTLATLRDTLLPKLLSGDISVPIGQRAEEAGR